MAAPGQDHNATSIVIPGRPQAGPEMQILAPSFFWIPVRALRRPGMTI